MKRLLFQKQVPKKKWMRGTAHGGIWGERHKSEMDSVWGDNTMGWKHQFVISLRQCQQSAGCTEWACKTELYGFIKKCLNVELISDIETSIVQLQYNMINARRWPGGFVAEWCWTRQSNAENQIYDTLLRSQNNTTLSAIINLIPHHTINNLSDRQLPHDTAKEGRTREKKNTLFSIY